MARGVWREAAGVGALAGVWTYLVCTHIYLLQSHLEGEQETEKRKKKHNYLWGKENMG